MYPTLIAAMVGSLIGSAIIGAYAETVAHRLGLVDWPDVLGGRKQHQRPTPLVGGLATCLATIVAALLTAVVNFSFRPFVGAASDFLWFAFAVGSMFLIGVADDRHTLSPRTRLAASIMILLVVLSGSPAFSLTYLHFGSALSISLGSMGVLFTLICLVGLLNAVNMADGKNGLVISLCLIWCAVLAASASSLWWPVLGATAVSLSVMLWFNMKGKLFLGDGGSYGLSAVFGLLAIHTHAADPAGLSADRVALMFIVPVMDTIRLVSIRVFKGASPFSGDRDHLHHHLARRWGWPNGLMVYCALVGIPNLTAALLPSTSLPTLLMSVLAYILVMSTSHVPEDEVVVPSGSNVAPFPKAPLKKRVAQPELPSDEDAA